MKGKIFTPEEANRMLPLVSRIATDIVSTYAEVHQALKAFEAEKARGPVAGSRDPEHDIRLRRLDGDVATLLDKFQGLIEEIEALGGTVKDYERGCIDFYGELDGEIVYLCWQLSEERIGYWHRLDEGFSKRQALPIPSAA